MKRCIRMFGLIFVITPIIAWFVVKPLRVIAPELYGISCPSVCIDDPSRLAEAEQLYNEGLNFIANNITPLTNRPKFIFCSTAACADNFGLGERSAVTVGSIATVIRPRAWHNYYVRHELIHHLQVQQLGLFSTLLKPSWFTEGMAYTLSLDPRQHLPKQYDQDRLEFSLWYKSQNKQTLWQAATQL